MKESITEKITVEELLEEIAIILKDDLIAKVRRKGDELTIVFPSGQKFGVLLWEETKKA